MKRLVVVLTVWAMSLAGALGAVVLPEVSASAAVPGMAAAVSTNDGFTGTAPYRVLDTRNGTGAPTAKLGAGQSLTLTVPGLPAGATAVAVNVTVTGPTAGGYLSVYPGGSARPGASNLNFVPGQTIPNLVLVPLGPGNTVTFFNSAGTVNVIGDVVGSFQPGTGAGFTGTAPYRVLDTRNGTGAPTAKLGAGQSLTLTVPGLPAGATAVAVNVTVTGPTAGGYLSVYPGGSARPGASNLNFVPGQTIPNLVLVPLGPGNTVTFFNSAGTVNVIGDVVGSFQPGTGAGFTGTAPYRVLDTRNGTGAPTAKLGAGQSLTLTVPGLPAGATAVAVNVTVTGPTAGGYLSVYPGGSARPGASNLNFVPGQTIPNLVLVPLGPGGTVTFFNSAGTVNVIGDVVGSFQPGTTPTPTDVTAPGPVAALTAVVTDTSIALAWINPSDADFTGVTIRRSPGANPPASVIDGSPVAVPASATARSFTDTGLSAGTQYSYAVFAHDGAGNLAVPAFVTSWTSGGTSPTPLVSISLPLGAPTTKLTKGVRFDFDARLSAASPGKTLSSATLDYGDGTVETFTTDPAFWASNHAYTTTGPRTVTLTVTDSAGISVSDVVTVTVFGAPTSAVTATSAAQVAVPFPVTLAASTPAGTVLATFGLDVIGPDGTRQSYSGDGSPPAAKNLTFATPGDYTVHFSVGNDAGGQSADAAITVHVAGVKTTAALSIISSGIAATRVTMGAPLTFDASGSFAGPAGRTLTSASLDYGDGTTPESLRGDPAAWSPEHSYTVAGTYTATLTVTDSSGGINTDVARINVYDQPTTTVTATGPAHVGVPFTFTLESATPAGTAILGWTLNFWDGGYGTTPPATLDHTFTDPGVYTVSFSLGNDAGGEASSSVEVTVLP
ncbi:MAG: PKD domain-containing protein [Actinomycetota bacterium]